MMTVITANRLIIVIKKQKKTTYSMTIQHNIVLNLRQHLLFDVLKKESKHR